MGRKSRRWIFLGGGAVGVAIAWWFVVGFMGGAQPVSVEELEAAAPEVIRATAEQRFDAVGEMVTILESGEEVSDDLDSWDADDGGVPPELKTRWDRVLEVLKAGQTFDTAGVETARLEMVFENVARFFVLRFGTRNPAPYISWRDAAGYRFVGWEWLHRTWMFAPAWEIFLPDEPPLPESGDHREPFAKLFNVVPDWRDDGSARPVKIAGGEQGVVTVTGQAKLGGFEEYGEVENDLLELWSRSAAVGSLCGWWDPPRSGHEIAMEEGSYRFAIVVAVMEYADGHRLPMKTKWIWDPSFDSWFLDSLSVARYDHSHGLAVCY